MHLIGAMDVAQSAMTSDVVSSSRLGKQEHDVDNSLATSALLPKPMLEPKPWALPMAKAHSPWKRVASTSNTPVVCGSSS